tara:strand:+ start:241 stop:462 length:222 start_codon:yes stop_codon:yes gene_type:complete
MKKTLKKITNRRKKPVDLGFQDRRNNNPQLDAHAIARGLKRRRDDKVNDAFFTILVSVLVFVLGFFTVGSLFI